MAVNQRKTGAILSYVIIVLNVIVGLIYTPFMLRMLGQHEYGLLALVTSVIGYLTILDFGFGNAVIRYTAKYRAEGKTEQQAKLYGMFLKLYSFIGLTALIVGCFLYFNVDLIFGNKMEPWELDKTRILMIIMIVNVAFTFPLSVFGGIITAYERFIFVRIIQILNIIFSRVIFVAILFLGYKAIALALVMTIFNFITLSINYFYSHHKLKIKIKFGHIDKKILHEILYYSFWIFLNLIMDKVYWSTGQFVLGAMVGTVAIAIFAIAIQFENMFMSFSTAVSGVFLPKITAMVSNGSSEKDISDLFIRIGRIQNYIVLFIILGFMIFGQRFVNLWAGEDYNSAYLIAFMFFIALYIPLIQNMGILILQARNQLKFRSLLYVGISLCCLIIQIPMAYWFGGIGCAIAISGSLLLGQGLTMNIYYHKVQHINIKEFWVEISKISLPLIIISIIAKVGIEVYNPTYSIIEMLVGIIIFTLIYWGVSIFFSMNSYEKETLIAPIVRRVKNIF